MAEGEEVYVFDTGPLSAFTNSGHLDLLAELVRSHAWKAEMPRQVQDELQRGIHSGVRNQRVLDASWLDVVELESDKEWEFFAHYYERLGTSKVDRNLGECAVLARAEANGATAVVDDKKARKHGKRRQVAMTGSLALVLEALRSSVLTSEEAEAVVNSLRHVGYRLPMDGQAFVRWAHENGLIDVPPSAGITDQE